MPPVVELVHPEPLAAATLQLTAVLLLPVTVAVNCAVLGVMVLTEMEMGGVGPETLTETLLPPPPPPPLGEDAMQPPRGRRLRIAIARTKDLRPK
jgi:hypothetical protein